MAKRVTPTSRSPKSPRARDVPDPLPAAQRTRQVAAFALDAVLRRGVSIDTAITEQVLRRPRLEPRDRAFAHLVTAHTVRRLGSIDHVLAQMIERPLAADTGPLVDILRTATAQLLLVGTPPHAAISETVDLVRRDRRSARFDKLANAVLRRIVREGQAILAALDPVALDVPARLRERWAVSYGETTARKIAAACLGEPSLDLTAKADPDAWAARLGGIVLSSGSVRLLEASGRIEALDGFADGEWWVQDAAAAIPVRMLGPVAGLDVADLCAAPGGKTAQLAASGARVTAVDVSPRRIERLSANLARLKLPAGIVEADVRTWQPPHLYDIVVLDAPCTATGTIRRHADMLRSANPADVEIMARRQGELIDAAARFVKPGGRLLYCTCSLEPEESHEVVRSFLTRTPTFRPEATSAEALGLEAESLTPDGFLRTLPHHAFLAPPGTSGMDGFFAAVLRRS
ncbi:MAG: RsmB/NOP family class I SAM-dependent RNA methyltransferase [Hyphomicrobiales bacterium]|nr:RsmB/NOP family class I SAM-dependent RNA methyltransferase [Hyphomicrobiales bacterium]